MSSIVRKLADSVVRSINGKKGEVTLSKVDVGLSLVDNTSDSTKNVLSASRLAATRYINGVPFNGTANITVSGSNGNGNRYVSTGGPSGGSDGDTWLKY